MMVFDYCRGPEGWLRKWAGPLRMDGNDLIAEQETGVLEVPISTTRGHTAIAIQGALDVVDLGARRHEKRIITRSGIDMAMKIQDGYHPRKMVIVVSI